MRRIGMMVMAVLIGGGCVDSLPDQDLRIVDAVPVEKLSAEILWQEYQADVEAADARYWGRAVEVTGRVTAADSDTVDAYVMFAVADEAGVRAAALDEAAADIIAAAEVGARLTLKCFCAGLDGNVLLKSCVLPRS